MSKNSSSKRERSNTRTLGMGNSNDETVMLNSAAGGIDLLNNALYGSVATPPTAAVSTSSLFCNAIGETEERTRAAAAKAALVVHSSPTDKKMLFGHQDELNSSNSSSSRKQSIITATSSMIVDDLACGEIFSRCGRTEGASRFANETNPSPIFTPTSSSLTTTANLGQMLSSSAKASFHNQQADNTALSIPSSSYQQQSYQRLITTATAAAAAAAADINSKISATFASDVANNWCDFTTSRPNINSCNTTTHDEMSSTHDEVNNNNGDFDMEIDNDTNEIDHDNEEPICLVVRKKSDCATTVPSVTVSITSSL
ncbi:unnamed protein product [Anisakis simplex]|uniref:Uncharacterized protein n=1 Tax=Anisakis simplex TaxID=6269 RepID=A0A0M3JT65_ANISI|nr:unnamed protein product [Anisakis simplex]